MSELPTYVLERLFDAPRELVWRTWTEPELLAHWYGPGIETVIHRLDVKPGGLWLNEMKRGANSMYQRAEYIEVAPPERLVMLMSSTDEAWTVTANPMMADWPKVLLTTVTFAQQGAQTKMQLVWAPHEASEAEIACFSASIEGMGKGWGAGMDLLAELLKELQV